MDVVLLKEEEFNYYLSVYSIRVNLTASFLSVVVAAIQWVYY